MVVVFWLPFSDLSFATSVNAMSPTAVPPLFAADLAPEAEVLVELLVLSVATEPSFAARRPPLAALVVLLVVLIDLLLATSVSATSPTAVLPPVAVDLPPLTELLFRLPLVDLLFATSETAMSPMAVPPPLADDLPAPPDVLVCD